MKYLIQLGVAATVLAIASAGLAYPSLIATTGIVGLPTAYTVPQSNFDIAADVLFKGDSIVFARALYGLTPNVEVGAGLAIGDDDGVILNGKYRFNGTFLGFTPALGLTYSSIEDSDEDVSGSQIYFVGSRELLTCTGPSGTGLTGTLGVSFTDVPDFRGFRPFAGAQLFMGRTEIGGEFGLATGDLGDSILSLEVRQRFSRTFTMEIGVTNAVGLIGTEDHFFFIGASLAMPGTRSRVAGSEETTSTVCPPPPTATVCPPPPAPAVLPETTPPTTTVCPPPPALETTPPVTTPETTPPATTPETTPPATPPATPPPATSEKGTEAEVGW